MLSLMLAAAAQGQTLENVCDFACVVQVPDGAGGFDQEMDSDCDSWLDADDNCVDDQNADQADGDSDDIGDACDTVCVGNGTNVDTDWTITSNPSNDWSYGRYVNSVFTLNPYSGNSGNPTFIDQWRPNQNNLGILPKMYNNATATTKTSLGTTYPTDAIVIQPDTTKPGVVRYTVPAGDTGEMNWDVRFESARVSGTTADTNVFMYHNGTQIFSGSVTGLRGGAGATATTLQTLQVVPGDMIEFWVDSKGAGASYDYVSLRVFSDCTP